MGIIQVEWPFLVCVAEVVLFIVAAVLVLVKYEEFRPSRNSRSDKESPVHFDGRQISECCSGVLHPGWLCAFRAVAFLYMLPVQLLNVLTYGVTVYIFYTQWTFTILIVYFLLATCFSLKEVFRPKRSGEAAESLLEEGKISSAGPRTKPGFLGHLTILIFQVVTASVLLTDAIYWLILVPFVYGKRYYLTFTSFSMHAVNAFFLLGELFLNTMPFPWFRGAYFILLSATFVVFQWIIHATDLVLIWPYPFLDVSTYWAPVWYLGLGLFHLLIYLICVSLARTKRPLVNLLSH